ncbi:hypothetical protein ACOSQ2_026384 [Xanthoceras sorbifolium]
MKLKILPPSCITNQRSRENKNSIVSGFGFQPHTEDYKIVRIEHFGCDDIVGKEAPKVEGRIRFYSAEEEQEKCRTCCRTIDHGSRNHTIQGDG